MPRRPRPVGRKPPGHVGQAGVAMDSYSDGEHPRMAHWNEQDDLEGSESESKSKSLPSSGSENDTPRFVQWEDPEDLEVYQPVASTSKITYGRESLSDLPLGALKKAQHSLTNTAVDNDSEDESEKEEDSDVPETIKSNSARVEKKIIQRRSNKHAPIEITSKKPVTRRRTVVDIIKHESRDPRFLPISGEFSSDKFRQSYSFLEDKHVDELHTLRENLKRARRRLASTPRGLLADREAEIDRLELAVKRGESAVNRDRNDRVGHAALRRSKQEEQEKVKRGKHKWFMKDSEKKDILMRARYDALNAEGGRSAVKKAIEKKRRKVGQKEKKSRPFGKAVGDKGKRRPIDNGDSGRHAKKRRIDT